MNIIHPFLAQNNLPMEVVVAPWQKMDNTTRDILIILGAVALVTFFALIWALVFRSKRRKRRHHHHHHHHHASHAHSEITPEAPAEPELEEPAEEFRVRRKRRRHRRREHRPRNPTLAETGGLPPLRSAPPPEP